DVIRLAVIAQSETVSDNGLPHHDSLDHDTRDAIGRETIRHVLHSVLADVLGQGSAVTIRKVKTSGCMIVDSPTQMRQVSILDEVEGSVRRELNGNKNQSKVDKGVHK